MIELNQKEDPTPEAKPSATLILVRDRPQGIECLLLRRNPMLKVMGGAWVFPGGKVDDTDAGGEDDARFVHAAIRELREETGLHALADQLLPFSRWLTPEIVKYRFDTRFFVQPYDSDEAPVVDGEEIVEYKWLAADQALRLQEQGELVVAPPTLVSLIDVADAGSVATLRQMIARRVPPFFFPKIRAVGDDRVFLYPGDQGYESGDPALSDPCHRTLLREGRYSYRRSFDWPLRPAD